MLPCHHLADACHCTELRGEPVPTASLASGDHLPTSEMHTAGGLSYAPGLSWGQSFRSLCGTAGRPHIAATIFPSSDSSPFPPFSPCCQNKAFKNKGRARSAPSNPLVVAHEFEI